MGPFLEVLGRVRAVQVKSSEAGMSERDSMLYVPSPRCIMPLQYPQRMFNADPDAVKLAETLRFLEEVGINEERSSR